MNPSPVPQVAIDLYPNDNKQNIGPPPGVPVEECGFLPSLTGSESVGTGAWPVIRSYWRPSDQELETLVEGGYIELSVYAVRMIPVALGVIEDE